MFFRRSESNVHQPFLGCQRRQAAVGASSQLMEFVLKKGTEVPLHHHPHEQIGMIISGQVRFHLGSETSVLGPGDGYFIPPEVEHSVDILEDSFIIDVFTPPRDDYRDP